MNWKKIVPLIAVTALTFLSSCNLQTSAPASEGAVASAVAQTLNAQPGSIASVTSTSAAQQPTALPPLTATLTAGKPNLQFNPSLIAKPPVIILPVANTTCNKMTLYVNPSLATGSTCKNVPEDQGPGNPPIYADQLALQGYILADRYFAPHIDVFNVQSLQQAIPDIMNLRLPALQSLINGTAPGTTELPLLPVFEAAQEFYAQYQVVPFGNGSGIRYLTEYAQFYDPINNHDMFYSYQGLTSDGKYWISAILPMSNPILPDNGNNPPNGQSWDAFGKSFSTYIADITGKLNSKAEASFTPTLSTLDAMMSSITIKP